MTIRRHSLGFTFPDESFILDTGASNVGIGGALSQQTRKSIGYLNTFPLDPKGIIV